jgi:hypothetical protein
MNKTTFNTIRDSVTFLQITELHKYQEYFLAPLSIAIDIIAVVRIDGGELTLNEIATRTGHSLSAVVETVRALRSGGYPFVVRVAGTQGNKLLVSIKQEDYDG